MSRTLRAFPKGWFDNASLQRLFTVLPEARLVGGCVRDGLLGMALKDIDLAVPLLPEEVLKRLSEHQVKALPTGLDHGTVTAVLDHQPFEITSLRRDVEHDGRWAKVEYTKDWREDAFRRDLTINALYMDKEGTIYDYASGLEDLQEGRVRFMGNAKERMREDYLRILRFFRFHSRYALSSIDEEAAQAAEELAADLTLLSAERVQAELFLLLLTPRISETWREMMARQIVGHLIPQATQIERLPPLLEAERELHIKPDPVRRLAALLEAGSGAKIGDRLKLSNQDRERLAALTSPDKALPSAEPHEIRKAIYRWGNDFVLDRALVDNPESRMEYIRLAQSWPRPAFPLTGKDLLGRGVAAGPEMGQQLMRIEEWWISEDFVPDKEACLRYAGKTEPYFKRVKD